MKIIIAPDSFKGSMNSLKAAQAMEQGVRLIFPEADIRKIPIADGGEGTVQALVEATGGTVIHTEVTGPLGSKTPSYYGILGDGDTAVVEMAAASGLPLVPKEQRNPLITTTYGTGELIRQAAECGCKRLIIGIGGSATNDGGAGMAMALGVRLLDSAGKELGFGGGQLKYLATIDMTHFLRYLHDLEVVVACDVDNPLCGPRGASAVYGPQKGATPEMVRELDAALAHYATILEKTLGKKVAESPGAGAAGGLGAGLMAFLSAQLKPGIEIVLETSGFRRLVRDADLVITGEGCTDAQTSYGKAPVGVAKAAKEFGVPVIAISGGARLDAEPVFAQGIDAIFDIVNEPMTLEHAMAHGQQLLTVATARAMRALRTGMRVYAGEAFCAASKG